MEVKDLVRGGLYNWQYQQERLIYLGKNFSGNGYWHQFALVDEPFNVWCEVLDSDITLFEETDKAYNDSLRETYLAKKLKKMNLLNRDAILKLTTSTGEKQ